MGVERWMNKWVSGQKWDFLWPGTLPAACRVSTRCMNQRRTQALLKAEQQAGEEMGRQSAVCLFHRMQSGEAASFSPHGSG